MGVVVLIVFTLDIFTLHCRPLLLSSGPHRAQFLIESVNDLRNTLRQLGSDLVVAAGPPEEHIPKLIPPGTKATVRVVSRSPVIL